MDWRDKQKEMRRYSRLFDFEYFLDFEYNAIISFLIESEETINKKEQEIESKIESWKIERRSHDDVPEPFDMFETEIIEFGQFPLLLNNSFFVTSYSIFEKYFNELCLYCKEEENIQKPIISKEGKKRRLSYIKSCKLFIEDVVQVCLDNLNNMWIDVEKYRDIRNAIVHNNGVLKESAVQNEELIQFIKTNESIDYDENNKTVSINSIEFIFGFTKLVNEFYSDLLSEIYKQRKSP